MNRYTTTAEDRKQLHRMTAGIFIAAGVICICIAMWAYSYGRSTVSWPAVEVKLFVEANRRAFANDRRDEYAEYTYRIDGQTYTVSSRRNDRSQIFFDPDDPWKRRWKRGVS